MWIGGLVITDWAGLTHLCGHLFFKLAFGRLRQIKHKMPRSQTFIQAPSGTCRHAPETRCYQNYFWTRRTQKIIQGVMVNDAALSLNIKRLQIYFWVRLPDPGLTACLTHLAVRGSFPFGPRVRKLFFSHLLLSWSSLLMPGLFPSFVPGRLFQGQLSAWSAESALSKPQRARHEKGTRSTSATSQFSRGLANFLWEREMVGECVFTPNHHKTL